MLKESKWGFTYDSNNEFQGRHVQENLEFGNRRARTKWLELAIF